jgi:membrane peptidoglycan carboxypeptidase
MASKRRKINRIKKKANLGFGKVSKKILSIEMLKLAVVLAAMGFIAILGIFGWVAKDLPSPDRVNDRLIAQSTVIYASNGQPIWEIHGDKNRTLIDFDDMPQYLKDATISIEDKEFYKHSGFSLRGVARAFSGIIFRDRTKGGGSTITQQLIKNAILSPEQTYTRKIKEVILSIQIEQKYSKDDILKMYLNEIPYGMNAYGAEAAYKSYFGVKAKQASEKTPENLAKAAVLAALPQAPTYLSPYGQNYDALTKRKNLVLSLMVQQGKITEAEASAAKEVDIKNLLIDRTAIDGYGDISYPHFSLFVKEKLVQMYGERMATQGGLRVYTTLDVEKQDFAMELLNPKTDKYGHVKRLNGYGATNAGLISIDPRDGSILAMVGSLDFRNTSINGYVNITTSARQPGSSFKPLVYATAWKKNWGPGSILYDLTTDFGGGYKPANYDGIPKGARSMREALAGSLNISAVKAVYLAGVQETINTSHDLGITDLKRGADFYGLPLALGTGEVKPLDLASAYGTFANMGERQDIKWFTKITDSKGKVIEEKKAEKGKQVIDSEIAYMINDVMSDNSARAYVFGTNNRLNIPGKKVAAKTGTTESHHDAWTAGYSRNISTVVWVGNNDNRKMSRGADGSVVAAPIWNSFMTKYADNIGWEKERPSKIQNLEIDTITGKKPIQGSKIKKDLFPSWYKLSEAGGTVNTFKIDKISGKLATPNCPEDAIEEVRIAKITAEIPPNDPSFTRWNAPILAWAASNGFATGTIFGIPEEECDLHDGVGLPGITFSNLYTGKTVTDTFEVRVSVVAPKGVEKVEIYVDNNAFEAQKISDGSYRAIVTAEAGKRKVRAKVWDKRQYSATSETVEVNVVDQESSLTLSRNGDRLNAKANSSKITSVAFYGIKDNGAVERIFTDTNPDDENFKYTLTSSDKNKYITFFAIGSPGNVKSNEV